MPSPERLSSYEIRLLDALLTQPEPMTPLALLGWHFDRHATMTQLHFGMKVISELQAAGWVRYEGDYLVLNPDRRRQLQVWLRDLRPAEVILLQVLFDSDRWLSAEEITQRLPAEFFKFSEPADHRLAEAMTWAYVVAMSLNSLAALRKLRCANSFYRLSPGHRAMLRYRFPGWNEPSNKPPACQGDQSVRTGRGVELE